MTTEEKKMENLVKIINIAMYGINKGKWDLYGEAAFATTQSMNENMLEALEKEAGLKITGENPEEIITELTRLMVDEFGIMSACEPKVSDKKVSISCKECFLREATGWLQEAGVQPFACVPMNVSAAAMNKKLGIQHRLLGRDWDPKTQTCTINFELV